MKRLTKKQQNEIYNSDLWVDDWEYVPAVNHVLKVLNYKDRLDADDNYEHVKWIRIEENNEKSIA